MSQKDRRNRRKRFFSFGCSPNSAMPYSFVLNSHSETSFDSFPTSPTSQSGDPFFPPPSTSQSVTKLDVELHQPQCSPCPMYLLSFQVHRLWPLFILYLPPDLFYFIFPRPEERVPTEHAYETKEGRKDKREEKKISYSATTAQEEHLTPFFSFSPIAIVLSFFWPWVYKW